mmetsp:Transcript_102566/g.318913  ORF Transcript_102566/g.318913 Transcript_102566/m.318913 type:complete len:311 (-) Transcript_102566:214-1146(-)
MEQRNYCCGTLLVKLLPLGEAEDLLVCLGKRLPDGDLDLLVPRRGLYLLLSELCEDVLVKLLCRYLGHLGPAVAVERAEVDAELIHGLVRGVAVPQLQLLARPALRMHPHAEGLGGHVVALPLLLQRLRSSMNGQRLAVLAEHHHLEGTRPAILLPQPVLHPRPLSQVDGVGVRAADDVPEVHEDALVGLLTLFPQGHDETKALLRVPLPYLALGLLLPCGRLLSPGLHGRRPRGANHAHHGLGDRRRRRHRGAARARRRPVAILTAGRSVAAVALVELHKLRGLDGLAHLLRLLHLPDGRVVLVLNLPK